MKISNRFLIPFTAMLTLVVASTVAAVHGAAAGLLTAFVLLASFSSILPGKRLENLNMGVAVNAIDSDLQLDTILDAALEAFKTVILPLRAFSTVFNDVVLNGTDKVNVPFYPLAGSASRDYKGKYIFDGSETDGRDVTINKRKYQSMSFSSRDLSRQPKLNPQKIGTQKGRRLAVDVLTDILSVVTTSNYGSPIYTGNVSSFDVDVVGDIKAALTKANWPVMGRGLIVNADYDNALFKDNALLLAYASGDGGEQLRSGIVRPFAGFDDYVGTPFLPTNGQNIVGMAVHESAILTAFSPIQPGPNVMKNLADYRKVTDEESGLTLEYRAWGDADEDADKAVIECNYGYNVGDAEALKLITSA